MEMYELIDNEKKSRYEYRIGRYRPMIEYCSSSGEIHLAHTHVPEALAGKGIATTLLRDVLRDIEQKGLKVVPVCPFIAHYLHKHPEWSHLLNGTPA